MPQDQAVTTFESLTHTTDPKRFAGIKRDYTVADVLRLRGSLTPAHTIAQHTATNL